MPSAEWRHAEGKKKSRQCCREATNEAVPRLWQWAMSDQWQSGISRMLVWLGAANQAVTLWPWCFALLIRPSEQGRGRHRTDPHCPTPHLPLPPLTPSLRLHPELKLLSPTWGNNLWCRLARMRPAGLVPALEAFPEAWNELGEGPRLPAWTCTWTVLAYGTFCACVKSVSAVLCPYWVFCFFFL